MLLYFIRCGTSRQVKYNYEVDKITDIPNYQSQNDPANPSTTTTSVDTTKPTESSNSSGANIHPFIWAISALAIVAAGMMML